MKRALKRKLRAERISRPVELMPASSQEVTSVREYENWVIKRADYFTCVIKHGPAPKEREEFPTLAEAIAQRGGNPKAMVYAVMNEGRSVMIGPAQFDEALSIRRTK